MTHPKEKFSKTHL